MPHWLVAVSTATILASVCLYRYHIDKYMSVVLPYRQEFVSTVTTQTKYVISVTSVYIVTTLASTVTTLASAFLYVYMVTILASLCQYCNHIGECLSILYQHWQVSQQCCLTTKTSTVITVTRLHLASACLYCYHTGKYLSELLPCWQVPVYTDVSSQYFYHIVKYLLVL